MAATFHFPPSELWEMGIDELYFWHEQVKRFNE
ncbi:MAG: GpE family phage tail protein [Gammaproteobacteria bacterium]|nr:GpE family phage tail protein [Gammaproteobacteria bacterium]